MAKQVLNKSTPSNRVDHVDQRNKINDNFTELYEGKVDKEAGKSLVTDAEKSNWNAASIGSDLGLLKTTDTPPPTGTHKGDVNSAGTYTNFIDSTSTAIVFTAPELVDNFGYIYVVDNVATKSLVAKKGGAGKAEDWTAKVYAVGEQSVYKRQIWEANAITSITDVPSISEKWTLKVGVKYNVRTYNLFNKDTVQIKKTVSATTGAITTSATRNVSDYIEVKPKTTYTRQTNATLFGKAFYDASKVFISGITTGKDFTTPENAKYVVYFVDDFATSNFETEALYEGAEMHDFVPYYAIETTNAFGLKTEQNKLIRNKLDKIFNDNPYYGDFESSNEYSIDLNISSKKETVIDPYFKNKGIINKMVSLKNSTASITRYIRLNYTKNVRYYNKYIYISVLFKTNYTPYIARNFSFKNESDEIVAYDTQFIKLSKIREDNTYVATVCISIPNAMNGYLVYNGMNFGSFKTSDFDFEIYGVQYFDSEYVLENDPVFTDLRLQDKVNNLGLNTSIKTLKSSFYEIEKKQEKKKWVLAGSSIENTGYLSEVAKIFKAELLDYSVSGAGTIWTDDPVVGANIWNIPVTASPEKAFSATHAEKIAYLSANGYTASDPTSMLKSSYDTSFMSNLDADVFMIGTLGGNDRKIPANYEISEARNRDRTCIYGALNYVLEKLFTAKPDAKVILFGQHHFMQTGREEANESQKQVGKTWCMPFLDMGRKLGFSAELVTVGGTQKMLGLNFLPDGTHPNAEGQKRLQEVLTNLLKSNLY